MHLLIGVLLNISVQTCKKLKLHKLWAEWETVSFSKTAFDLHYQVMVLGRIIEQVSVWVSHARISTLLIFIF